MNSLTSLFVIGQKILTVRILPRPSALISYLRRVGRQLCASRQSRDISTATEESWKFAKDAINSGFPKAAQDLMAVTAKVAGDKTVQGQTRAYWKRQANAVLADIKGQLARREQIAADIASGKQGADARTRTAEDITYEALLDCVARIQKADKFSATIDADDFCQAVEDLANQIHRS